MKVIEELLKFKTSAESNAELISTADYAWKNTILIDKKI